MRPSEGLGTSLGIPVAARKPARLAFVAILWMPAFIFGAFARAPIDLAGNWQSAKSVKYAEVFSAGMELYLNIDIAMDGMFRGSWGEYMCLPGYSNVSCSLTASGGAVTGKIEADGRGQIELENTGRSDFEWKATSEDGFTITLPKRWLQRDEDVLYKARLTRDGKVLEKAPVEEELLSAVALYREFDKNPDAAQGQHGGKTMTLEGRRGTLIPMSSGGAAVHVPDGFRDRALVLSFSDPQQLNGIEEGAKFTFQCRVDRFEYLILWMEDCSVVRD